MAGEAGEGLASAGGLSRLRGPLVSAPVLMPSRVLKQQQRSHGQICQGVQGCARSWAPRGPP